MNRERERIRKEVFGKTGKVAQEPSQEVSGAEVGPEINPGLFKMFPKERIKKLMEKEARKYKAALEKKWRNWFEAVSK